MILKITPININQNEYPEDIKIIVDKLIIAKNRKRAGYIQSNINSKGEIISYTWHFTEQVVEKKLDK